MTQISQPSTLPSTMLGMEINNGKLVPATLPLPKLAADEVLIRVAYVGINRADVMQRDGKYPAPEGASPLPGLEVSGWIAEAGQSVFTVGQEVCALLGGGGYAEYVAVPAGQVLALPKGISLQEAACLPEAAATSVMALGLEANLQVGERMLVHGGTSGLGLLMIQIAQAIGAEAFTTVGTDAKAAFLKPFGAHVINHQTTDFVQEILRLTENQGVDVIVDTIGGEYVNKHFSLLRRGGRMVSLAMMQGATLENLKIGRMLTHQLRWSGTTLRSRAAPQKAAIMEIVLNILWPQVETGAIRPVIDRTFPLAEAEKALAHMQERLHLGKILLEVASK